MPKKLWRVKMSVVIVTGGRKFNDYEFLSNELDKLYEELAIRVLLHGAAEGADSLANKWGSGRVCVIPIPAWWKNYDMAAGPIRNAVMLKLLKLLPAKRRLVIAFPGGTGTMNMVAQTEKERKAGVDIEIRKVGW
jgi:hypothetical protein